MATFIVFIFGFSNFRSSDRGVCVFWPASLCWLSIFGSHSIPLHFYSIRTLRWLSRFVFHSELHHYQFGCHSKSEFQTPFYLRRSAIIQNHSGSFEILFDSNGLISFSQSFLIRNNQLKSLPFFLLGVIRLDPIESESGGVWTVEHSVNPPSACVSLRTVRLTHKWINQKERRIHKTGSVWTATFSAF